MNENSYAIVIGVGQREVDRPQLAVTVVDAERVACELENHCGYRGITRILGQEATTQYIIRELELLINQTLIKKADLTIIYFSGHGCYNKEEDLYYLISWDTENDSISETGMEGRKFVQLLERINTEKLLILLDCCYAGSLSSDRMVKVTVPFPKNALITKKNRAVISSSHQVEVSYIGKPNSAFTYALVNGLSGVYFKETDRNVTLFDLAMFVREKVVALTKAQQHPQLSVLKDSLTSNFSIASYPNGRPKDYPCGRGGFKLYDEEGKEVAILSEKIKDTAYREEFEWLNLINIEKLNIVIQNPTINITKGTKKEILKELTDELPQRNIKEIKGRKEDLKKIRRILKNENELVVVNGIGGIGKTTLAEAYIFKYKQKYHHIAWVNLDSGDIENDFINTSGLIDILNIDNEYGLGKEYLFRKVIRALKGLNKGPNLLILDNASSNLKDYKKILPQSPNWHVLITSREEILGYKKYSLDYLSEKAALNLFLQHCSIIEDQEQIKELLKKIEYHTLTIEILAKTAAHHNISIEKLKNAIECNIKADVFVDHDGYKKITNVYTYLSSIFKLGSLSIDEIWLLQQFTCLPSNYISYKTLYELINPILTKQELIFSELLNNLSKKGWVQKKEEDNSFKVHRVIKEILIKEFSLKLSSIAPLVDNVSKKIRINQVKDNPIDKIKWLIFADILERRLSNISDVRIAYLQYHLGYMYRIEGKYERAKELQEKALKTNKKYCGENHFRTANSYSALALVLIDLKTNLCVAEQLLIKALEINSQKYNKETPSITNIYSNLGALYFTKGDYRRAQEMHLKALYLDEKEYKRQYSHIAIASSNLGIALKHMGEYNRPVRLLKRALLIDENNFGKKHPALAIRYYNLGKILNEKKQNIEAKNCLKKALRINRDNFGRNHFRTAIFYSVLGNIYSDLGNDFIAEILLKKGVEVLLEHYPDISAIKSAKKNLIKFENK
jgi:tetratricopeptide (TPR) repeat protein